MIHTFSFTFRCGVEVRLWRAIMNHRKQFKTLTEEFAHLNINNVVPDEINRNLPPVPIPPRIVLEKSSSGSNCNSYDSTSGRTNSSCDDLTTGSDYESCNGGSLDEN